MKSRGHKSHLSICLSATSVMDMNKSYSRVNNSKLGQPLAGHVL